MNTDSEKDPPWPKLPGLREERDASGKYILVGESEGVCENRRPKKTGSGHEKASQMSLRQYISKNKSPNWPKEMFEERHLNHFAIKNSSTDNPFGDSVFIEHVGRTSIAAARHKDRNNFPDDWIAVKTIRLNGSEAEIKKLKEDIMREVQTTQYLSELRHHHIVAFIGSYEMPLEMCIAIFPVAKYSLKALIKDMSETNRKKAVHFSEHHHVWAMLRYFLCLTSAVSWLHSMNVKHKDIKPANILIDCDQSIILADFGLSRIYESKEDADISVGRTEYTLTYAPAEAIDGYDRNLSSDLFSLACVFLEMITVICGETVEALTETLRLRADPNARGARQKCYASSPQEIERWIMMLKKRRVHPAAEGLLEEGLERVRIMMSGARGEAREAHECFKGICERAHEITNDSKVICTPCASSKHTPVAQYKEHFPEAYSNGIDSGRQPSMEVGYNQSSSILSGNLVDTPKSLKPDPLDTAFKAPSTLSLLPQLKLEAPDIPSPVKEEGTESPGGIPEATDSIKPSGTVEHLRPPGLSDAAYGPSTGSIHFTTTTSTPYLSTQASSVSMRDNKMSTHQNSDLPDPPFSSELPGRTSVDFPDHADTINPNHIPTSILSHGSADLPSQGSATLPNQGSAALPNQGSATLPNQDSTSLLNQGSTTLANRVSTSMSNPVAPQRQMTRVPPTQQQLHCIVRKDGNFLRTTKTLGELPGRKMLVWDAEKNSKRIEDKDYPLDYTRGVLFICDWSTTETVHIDHLDNKPIRLLDLLKFRLLRCLRGRPKLLFIVGGSSEECYSWYLSESASRA